MPTRTWPLLRLVFATPLDEARRNALLLDVDDCGAAALDEDGDAVALHFSSAADLLAARGWLTHATLTTEDVPDEGWAARSQANLPAVRVGRVIVAPPWDRPAVAPSPDVVVIEVEPG